MSASLLARRGDRLLWADLWARSHLIMFAPWLLIPISCALPLENANLWHLGFWLSLGACVSCGAIAVHSRARYRTRFVLLSRGPAVAVFALFILQAIVVVGVVMAVPYLAVALLAWPKA